MANPLKLTVSCGYETLIETTDTKLISATLFQYYHNTTQATLDAGKITELTEELSSRNSIVDYWEKEAAKYKKQLAELKAKLEEVHK